MNNKKEITITSDMVEPADKDRKSTKEWMKDPKYGLVYANLVDYAYSMQMKPDMDMFTDLVNSQSDEQYTKREIKAFIKALIDEGLVKEGTDRNAIVLHGYKVARLGKPLCSFCGKELIFEKEEITKTNYIKHTYKCDFCKAAAVFKVKGVVETS